MKWISYKIEIKDQYKTLIGAKTQYEHMVKLCHGDPDIAMMIVDQSISSEWKGLFELKQKPEKKIIPGESAIQRLTREMKERIKEEEEQEEQEKQQNGKI
jgi:hypothetical protein